MGKNLTEARGDVLKAIEVVELACALPVTMQGRSLMNVAGGYDTVSYREPLGVFVGIAPFNFPAMIPFGWMIPLAVTTGNTFVLKAASMVPQTVDAHGRTARPRPACPPACSTWSPAAATRRRSC